MKNTAKLFGIRDIARTTGEQYMRVYQMAYRYGTIEQPKQKVGRKYYYDAAAARRAVNAVRAQVLQVLSRKKSEKRCEPEIKDEGQA